MSPGGRRWPAVLRRPQQGWTSLLLLLAMLAALGVSVTASWPIALTGETSDTAPFGLLMVAAGVIGFLLARSSIGSVRAHLIGAAVAAVVLLLVGGALLLATSPMPTELDGIGERVAAVWERLDENVALAVQAYADEESFSPTMAVWLVLGAICWTTAQFSAFSIFRYDRGGPAVMAIGAVLFLNVGLASLRSDIDAFPVLPVLAVYSALAMLLLVRMQLMQQRLQWARRHIADTGDVSRLFLRTGTIFVALTVVSATSLTAVAMVDPQEADLGQFQEPAEDLAEELSRILGAFGVTTPALEPETFGGSLEVQDTWPEPEGTAFRATMNGPLRGNYWWGWSLDRFDGHTWTRVRRDEVPVSAFDVLPVQQGANSGGTFPAEATITIEGASLARGMLFRPAEAFTLDQDIEAILVDDGGGIGDIEYRDKLAVGDTVVVNSLVPDYSTGGRRPTANSLKAAGMAYPEWVTGLYLQGAGDPNVAGVLAAEMAAEVQALYVTPYEQAIEVQRQLSEEMEYTVDMQGVCGDEPVPDCLLTHEKGFCEHFGTTMVMVMREMGVPARLITGYLPGERVDEEWVVPRAALHNWVEVYFPDHGWIRFDPTPARRGFNQAATSFPDGPANPPSPGPSALPSEPPPTPGPDDTPEPTADAGSVDEGGGFGGDGGSTTAVLLGGGILLALTFVVTALFFVRLRRLPSADGSLAYRGIVSLATRLGYGPHPSQTEYEYASSLSEAIPTVRDDLYLVADARVESAYGKGQVEGEREGALRRAYARIRTALLRLSLGRGR